MIPRLIESGFDQEKIASVLELTIEEIEKCISD